MLWGPNERSITDKKAAYPLYCLSSTNYHYFIIPQSISSLYNILFTFSLQFPSLLKKCYYFFFVAVVLQLAYFT